MIFVETGWNFVYTVSFVDNFYLAWKKTSDENYEVFHVKHF
jgi:hypothetical protein